MLQGLLAGADDFELMEQGSIRDINRHYYSLEEAQQATRRPVVQVGHGHMARPPADLQHACLTAEVYVSSSAMM